MKIDRFRRRVAGIALILGPAALAVSLATKTVGSDDERAMLDAVAAAPTRSEVSSVAQLVAVILLIPATVAIVHLLRGRGSRLGHVAGALLVLNLVGNAADVVHSAVLGGLADDGVSAADVSLLTTIHADAGYGIAELCVLFGLLGFPVLAAALWRSGAVPRPIPAVLLVSVISFFFPISEGIGGVLMAVAFAWLGVTVLGTSDAEWRDGWREPAAAPVRGAAAVQPA